MSLRIYGLPASRTFRCLWAAEEAGLAYENVPWSTKGPEIKDAAYLAINPNGTIPALAGRDHLVGGEFTLADLNVAAVLFRAPQFGLDAFPNVKARHARCLARPAAKRAIAMREAKAPA
jgi:glutathione S-transferase